MAGLRIAKVKTYCKATVIRTVWYWLENTHMGQWNAGENLVIDPHKYRKLIFNKAKGNSMDKVEKEKSFQQMVQ